MKIYISNVGRLQHREYMKKHRLGNMLQGDTQWRLPRRGEDWALDNGAWYSFVHKTQWDELRYYSIVARIPYLVSAPDFLVIPDIIQGGLDSLKHSLKHLEKLPRDIPKYLPVQPGITLQDLKPHLSKIEGLFIGGSKEWKRPNAPWIIDAADRAGLMVHIGQVGTISGYEWAYQAGADSVDGSGPSQNNEIERPDIWRAAIRV